MRSRAHNSEAEKADMEPGKPGPGFDRHAHSFLHAEADEPPFFAGLYPAATPQATVTTGGLNQVRVSGAMCASTPSMSDSRTSQLRPLKKSYGGGNSNPAARVSALTLTAWICCSLLDNPRSNRPERRTALVARKLARYKVVIAALSEIRFSEQGQLHLLLERPAKGRATRRWCRLCPPERHRVTVPAPSFRGAYGGHRRNRRLHCRVGRKVDV
ncbi:unnamed protein product [Schistocephalus solidus]|uniref:WGS project CAFE00000000 data, contig n=1 Tax=Schistocephalus solidus TaxID=70667 RepID=A0A183SFF4_SCHSO|nr:unnamed protein product [Schistocephalus solidus]